LDALYARKGSDSTGRSLRKVLGKFQDFFRRVGGQKCRQNGYFGLVLIGLPPRLDSSGKGNRK
jgi:hypothetical protein